MMTGSKMATYIKGLFKLVIKLISTCKIIYFNCHFNWKKILEDLKKDYPFICLIEHVDIPECTNTAAGAFLLCSIELNLNYALVTLKIESFTQTELKKSQTLNKTRQSWMYLNGYLLKARIWLVDNQPFTSLCVSGLWKATWATCKPLHTCQSDLH